jgi:type IV pilus assembly protein PilA
MALRKSKTGIPAREMLQVRGTIMGKQNDGFTLLEMMIVVGIIAVIAAIAIPNLLRSKMEANEASAVSDLRTICAGQIACSTTRQTFGDFTALVDESDGVGTSFVETSWYEGRVKAGYTFTIPEADADSFICFADPVRLGVTGGRFFRIDNSGIVRYDASGQPGPGAPALHSS